MARVLRYQFVTYEKNVPHPDPLRAQYIARHREGEVNDAGGTWEQRLELVLHRLGEVYGEGWMIAASSGNLREFVHFEPGPFGRRLLISLCDEMHEALDK